MGKIISIGSLRGGTGKSTIINNLAVILAKKFKVIIIDFDTEAQTFRYLFKDKIKKEFNLNNFLISGKPGSRLLKIEDIIYPIKINEIKFSIIPSTNIFSLALTTFFGDEKHILNIKSKFVFILNYLKENYDFILIDTSPGFGNSMLMSLELSDIFIYILRDREIEYSSFIEYKKRILEKLDNKEIILLINSVFRTYSEIRGYLDDKIINDKLLKDLITINFDENLVRNHFSSDINKEIINEINLLNNPDFQSNSLKKGINKLVDSIIG